MSVSHSLSSLGDLFTVPNLVSNSPPKPRGASTNNNNGSSSSLSTTNHQQQNNSKSPSVGNNNKPSNNNNNNQLANGKSQPTNNNNQLITQQQTINNSIVPDSQQEEEISPIITFGKSPSFQTPKRTTVVQEEEALTPVQQEEGNNSDVFDDSDDDVVFLGSQPPPCFTNPSPNNGRASEQNSDSDSDEVSQITLTPVKTQRKRKLTGSAPTPSLYYSSSDDDEEVSDLEMDSVLTLRTEVSSQTPPPKKVKKSNKTQPFISDSKKIVKFVERMKKKKRHSHPSKTKLTPPSASLQHALHMQNQPIPIGAHPHSLPPPDHFRALSYPFQQFGASASTVGPSFNDFAIQHSQMIQHTIQMPPSMPQHPQHPQHLHNMIPHPTNDQILPPPIQSLQHQIQEQPIIEFPISSVPPIDLNSTSHQQSVPEASNGPSASTVPVETNHPPSDPSSSNAGIVKGEKMRGVSTNALVNLIMKFGPYCDDQRLLTAIFKSLNGMSIDEMCNEDVCELVLLNTPRSEGKRLEKEWNKKLAQKRFGPTWKNLVKDYPE
ncbi:predicted protein [Naegleria gruberi]|uniref:Predicted protein n=1 Tax=Naegleria gruberi TaxID=5762 RepID=D2VTF1_NAEGR|nr:uncharacterized protein NAEGRDRAFT_52107 [Naegleria gruberi]EFC39919.1 predicted protein [Naegleria gruberi]|eukprot:XP_002672663.1 predicted protein [Naegleria gruberi strain NEG-M]